MVSLELDLADGVVDRAQHRQHHPAQERAEDDGHGRLDHHLHLADGFFYVAIVEVGNVEQRVVESARGFPHPQHAYHQRREQAHILERGGNVLALGDLLSGAREAFPDHQVAGDFLGGFDAVENGNAGGIHHGENAGETRQDDLALDRPEERHAQLEIVEPVVERRAAFHGELDAGEGDHGREQYRPPVVDEKARYLDQDAGLQRYRLPGTFDEADHLRHQVDHQEHGYRQHDAADEGRVHQQLFCLRDEFVLPFQIFGEASELRTCARFLRPRGSGWRTPWGTRPYSR